MKKIDVSKWGRFELQKIFCKKECKKLPYKATELEKYPTAEADLPALTAGVDNQGLSVYVPRKNATILRKCISVSANGANSGTMFYQPNDFTVLQDSFAIQCLYESGRTQNVSLYLIAILSKSIRLNYDWKEKAGWNKIKTETILLPVSENGQPNWEYMEQYIEKVEEKVKKKLDYFSFLSSSNLRV